MKIYLDLETYCDLDLKKVGVYRYVEHPSFRVLLIGFRYGVNGATHVLDLELGDDEDELREFLCDIRDPAYVKVAHNANFDRVALSGLMWQRSDMSPQRFLAPDQWEDTMAKAAAMNYPQGLGRLADALGAAPKDKAGETLISYFSLPYRGKRRPPTADLQRWSQFVDYAFQDVDTLVEIDEKLLPLTDREQRIWQLDQRVNDRGITVDVDLAKWAEDQNAYNSKKAKAQLEHLLDIENAASVAQVRRGLADIGLELENLRAETVSEMLDREDLTSDQRLALELRSGISLTAAKKYTAALQMTSGDGRFRGGFRYHGAVTGRWTGRGIQLQNLPRAQMLVPETAVVDSLMGFGAEPETLKAMVRAVLTGPFIVSDFSAIEARVLAWLAGEQWALDAFRNDRDIYVETAERMGGLSRSQGKVAVLALGYGGGVGSLRSMGAEGDDETLDRFKSDWRQANRKIVKFWYDLEDAFESGSGVVGSGRIAVTSEGPHRLIHLPSGRVLMYQHVRRERFRKKYGDEYRVTNGLRFNSGGVRTETYSGKLAENCLAGDTEVLTDSGWKRIDSVQQSDRVWDGTQFVKHQGLISKGVQPVIDVSGVRMTPDHRVLTEEGWKIGQETAGHYRREIALPNSHKRRREPPRESNMGNPLRLWENDRDVSVGVHQKRTEILRMPARGAHLEVPEDAWHVKPPSLRGMAINARPLPTTVPSSVGELRRPRGHCVPSVGEFRGVLGRHGGSLPSGVDAGTDRQRFRLQPGELSVGNGPRPVNEQTKLAENPHPLGIAERVRGVPEIWDRRYDTSIQTECRSSGTFIVRETGRSEQVYDLVNTGPRNRFMVRDENGDPFIVHNCTQAVARDLLADAMLTLEDQGYAIVGHVHDEIIVDFSGPEYPTDKDVATVEDLMATPPGWAKDLPLGAEGFWSYRYKKG